ncbi:MAG: ester cyclase [Candidatus Acidiferrum sp.]
MGKLTVTVKMPGDEPLPRDGTFLLRGVIPGMYTVVAVEDAWGFDWLKAGVLARDVQKGQNVIVGRRGNATANGLFAKRDAGCRYWLEEEGKMVEENLVLVRRWFEEVWNQKRRETIRELVAPECVAHGTSETGGDLHGPEGWLDLHARLVNAFPDMHIELQDLVAVDDKVAVRWKGTMHHHGDGLGIPASGAEVKIAGMGFARIAGGKVVETWDLWDRLGMFQQIEAAAKAKAAEA